MKSYLLSFVVLISICTGLYAQNKPVQPLSKIMILVELEEDFSAFQQKVAQINLKKTSKAALAEEYSDLIDRIDQQFHTPKPKAKESISAMSTTQNKNKEH